MPWARRGRTSDSGLGASGRCEAGSTCSNRPWKLLLSSAACAATASCGFANWTYAMPREVRVTLQGISQGLAPPCSRRATQSWRAELRLRLQLQQRGGQNRPAAAHHSVAVQGAAGATMLQQQTKPRTSQAPPLARQSTAESKVLPAGRASLGTLHQGSAQQVSIAVSSPVHDQVYLLKVPIWCKQVADLSLCGREGQVAQEEAPGFCTQQAGTSVQ